ncbi:hypothetical protein VPNG_08970 [Cytospora leucostoma]|uniref:Apple domain-containing protein n=1 Tax=Cytospora leucostoma TaxID=1230097 RepID=A0A423VW89_9PEZI|nr:hypothetical protein VPNG_08970 [Cytospora leucostoma]
MGFLLKGRPQQTNIPFVPAILNLLATGLDLRGIDTPEAFQNYTPFHTAARIATTPLGYTLVGQALSGSVYGTVLRGVQYLTEYNTVTCAAMCTDMGTCTSFNIYCDAGCPNPNSTTNIKCVFWGSSISEGLALNRGEIRCRFRVIITGSNYYIKEDPMFNLTDLGFYGPRGDAQASAVFAPSELVEPTDGYATLIGRYRGFYVRGPVTPSYDPVFCANKCNAITQYNSINKVNATPFINGAYPKCNMFSIFEDAQVDEVPFSVVCFFFSTSWDSKYSTHGEIVRDGAKTTVSIRVKRD